MKTNINDKYKIFEGRYSEMMPTLIKEGYSPLSIKEIMEKRIETFNSKNKDEIDFWSYQALDSISGLCYYDNELIIIPESELLLNINSETKLVNGALPLTKKQFDEFKKYGMIKRKSLFNKIIFGRRLSKEEARNHPVWNELAQNDKQLLKEYVNIIFHIGSQKGYGYEEIMDISLPNTEKNPSLLPWAVGGLTSCAYTINLDTFGRNLISKVATDLEKAVLK